MAMRIESVLILASLYVLSLTDAILYWTSSKVILISMLGIVHEPPRHENMLANYASSITAFFVEIRRRCRRYEDSLFRHLAHRLGLEDRRLAHIIAEKERLMRKCATARSCLEFWGGEVKKKDAQLHEAEEAISRLHRSIGLVTEKNNLLKYALEDLEVSHNKLQVEIKMLRNFKDDLVNECDAAKDSYEETRAECDALKDSLTHQEELIGRLRQNMNNLELQRNAQVQASFQRMSKFHTWFRQREKTTRDKHEAEIRDSSGPSALPQSRARASAY